MNTFNAPSNSFIIDFRHRISRHNTRNHDHSRVDVTTPYPSMEDVVRRVQSTDHYNESLPNLHNNNTLFALAVKAHFDQDKKADKYERRYNVLRRVLSMGICDWDADQLPTILGTEDSLFASLFFLHFCSSIRSLRSRLNGPHLSLPRDDLMSASRSPRAALVSRPCAVLMRFGLST